MKNTCVGMRSKLACRAAIGAAVALSLSLAAAPAQAAVIVVNNAGDAGPGSLRAAIIAANGTAAADTIVFNLGAPAVYVINLVTPLPAVTRPLTIDGLTQAGAACPAAWAPNLEVVLNGAGAGAGAGLTFTGLAAGSLVRGLVVQGFNGDGVILQAANVALECNFIGTTVAGTAPLANAGNGVQVNAPGARIGGATGAQRNVIAGNALAGVLVSPAGVGDQGNSIANNFIGLGVGPVVVNNGGAGVRVISQPGTEITRNLISANVGFGPIGIDLGLAGATPNDPGDVDAAPIANSGQNFPVITAASAATGLIDVTLDTLAGNYRLEYFTSPVAGPLGRQYLGSLAVAHPGGVAAYTSPVYALFAGQHVTVTATRLAAPLDSSEFSVSRVVGP